MSHAIVVGASSGIGAAIGRALRGRGHTVSGLSRRPAAQGAADASYACDAGDPAALGTALDRAEAAAGAPDVLVYAAGHAAMGRTLAVPEGEARRAFEVTFWGLDAATRWALPRMAARRQGKILAVLSLAAVRPVPYEAYYAAAKAAAARYLGCLAHEAARDGVAVRYLCPGYIDTGFLERSGWFGMDRPVVHGSGVTPEDVAAEALRLLEGRRPWVVLGWRERAIVLGDRLVPGLYDRLLQARDKR